MKRNRSLPWHTSQGYRPVILFWDKPGKLHKDQSENPHQSPRSLRGTDTARIELRQLDRLRQFK